MMEKTNRIPDQTKSDSGLMETASRYAVKRCYTTDEMILKEGDAGNTMIMVVSGRVKILKKSTSSVDEVVIGRRGPGEFLGEMALVENLPRSATVIADCDCEVLEFSKESFEKIISKEPKLATQVLNSLSSKLRESDYMRILELEESNRILSETNQELVRLNAFLDCVIDQSPSGILLATRKGDIFRINRAAIRMFDIESPEKQISVENLFKDFSIEKYLASGKDVWSSESIGIRGNDNFPAYVSVTSLSGHNNSLLHLIICQDISELLSFNKFLAEFERYSSTQTTTVELAHDLNNLLATLYGNVELVLRKLTDEQIEKMSNYINTIQRSQKDITHYVETVMSCPDDNTEHRRVNIEKLVRAVVRFCHSNVQFEDIIIGYEIDPQTSKEIMANEGQIQSILVNLLMNAAQAFTETDKKLVKRVRIDVHPAPGSNSIEITVSDNGAGISADRQKRLFKERVTTKKDGHGIGLISVKRLVELHGGEIKVSSRPGDGAEFTITLPPAGV